MVHPKIQQFIDAARKHGYNTASESLLLFLRDLGATQTEATFVLDHGFSMTSEESENYVLNSKIFNGETMEDFVYQTFLYANYDPENPHFKYDNNMVQFPLDRKKKQS